MGQKVSAVRPGDIAERSTERDEGVTERRDGNPRGECRLGLPDQELGQARKCLDVGLSSARGRGSFQHRPDLEVRSEDGKAKARGVVGTRRADVDVKQEKNCITNGSFELWRDGRRASASESETSIGRWGGLGGFGSGVRAPTAMSAGLGDGGALVGGCCTATGVPLPGGPASSSSVNMPSTRSMLRNSQLACWSFAELSKGPWVRIFPAGSIHPVVVFLRSRKLFRFRT